MSTIAEMEQVFKRATRQMAKDLYGTYFPCVGDLVTRKNDPYEYQIVQVTRSLAGLMPPSDSVVLLKRLHTAKEILVYSDENVQQVALEY
jgi:AraC-like DNA-binding protein